MPGPLPQPNKRPRPSRDLPWVELPAAGRSDIPRSPRGLGEAGKQRWRDAWATPSATQWIEAEAIPQVRRLCQLEDLWSTSGDVRALGEMRHLESALGLTPKSRLSLRWRIVDEVDEVQAPAPPPRRLRVIDAG